MTEPIHQPFQLFPLFRERVWGRRSLAPFFAVAPRSEPIGEVWFTFQDNETSLGPNLGALLSEQPGILGTAADPEYPAQCPLLVKFLFTTSRLSVQVHPDDEYARRHHGTLGKTEAWYVLDSQPPGEVAAGFREEITPERLRVSALSGEIEQLLDWGKVEAGDIVFVPAGTVHAIGAGLTICEIQENSDITYRLYDYGRPRELHLDDGVQVSKLGSHQAAAKPKPITEWRDQLLKCAYFRIERMRVLGRLRFAAQNPYYILLICIEGEGHIGGKPFTKGQVWMVPANSAGFALEGTNSRWIVTYTADERFDGVLAD
ncbi:MAG: type I phosphomannose isomerase catalytic subunit [Bryobacteraceae bacterium]